MWLTLAVTAGLAAIGAGIDYFTRDDEPAQKRDPLAQPSIPMVSESDPIPVVFGRARLTGPNIIWYSGPRLFPASGKQELLLRVFLVWCHGPVDYVARPRYGDRALNIATQNAPVPAIVREIDGERQDVIFYRADMAFGSAVDDYGPAFLGSVWFGMQTETDPGGYPMDELDDGDAILTDDVGVGYGFRHVVSIAGELQAGSTQTIEGLSLEVGRTDVRSHGDVQWYAAKANINLDMNGSHILRECLTDTMWGMEIPESKIDDASFQVAADILYQEGFGLSGVHTQETPVEEYIERVLEHIDGALYQEPTTGLYTVKLARADYVVGDLPVLNDSNCTIEFTRPSPHELPTRVTILYQDFDAEREQAYPLVNPAAHEDRGEINVTRSYPLICTHQAAARIAARDLRQLSTPLARVRITEAHWSAAKDLRSTQLFVLESEEHGITQMICRVATIDFGTTTNNAITVEAVEDAFAFDAAVFTDPPDSEWEDPLNAPAPPASQFALEPTLWMSYQADLEDNPHASQVDYADRTSGYAALVAERPSDDALNYDLFVEGATSEQHIQFSPVLITTGIIVQEATSAIGWENDVELDASRRPLLQIGDELVIGTIGSVDNAARTLTVNRGWGDTVPAPDNYAPGTAMYLLGYVRDTAAGPRFDRLHGLDRSAWPTGSDVDCSALTRTPLGQLLAAEATVETITMSERAYRPLPPCQLEITDNSDPVEFRGSVDLSWEHRNRFEQPASEPSSTQVNVEADASYTVRVFGPEKDTGDEILYHTQFDVTGYGYSYPNNFEVSQSTWDGLAPWLRFEVEAVREDDVAVISWQFQDRRMDR